jgi:osmoprotectant transport system permease protein
VTYLFSHPGRVGALLGEHIALVAVALLIALAIALPLGIYAARKPRAASIVLGTASVIYTIPSLALLALLTFVFGLGSLTAVIALALYAQLVLLRGIVAGLQGVDPALVDAARGIGLTARQAFFRVELPAALPVMLAGLRVASVTLVALATVAGWIDAGGLGTLLFEGLRTSNPAKEIAAALAAAGLAIIVDVLLRSAEKSVQA